MLETGEFRGTAIDCRARSSATARGHIGSRRRRSRRMWALVRAAAAAVVLRAAAAVVVLRAAAVRVAAVGPLVAGRYNEAESICGRFLRFPKIMNAGNHRTIDLRSKVGDTTVD